MTAMKANMLLVFATFFWGATFSLTKYSTDYLSTMSMVSVRFLIAAILILLLYRKKILLSFLLLCSLRALKENKEIWLLGILNVIAILLQTEGLRGISATNSGFITSLAIIFVPFFEVIYLRSKITLDLYVMIAVALVGVYLMSFGFSLPKIFLIGDLYTLISAIVYSYYIVLVSIMAKKGITSEVMMFWNFFITAIATGIIMLFLEGEHILRPLDGEFYGVFLFLIVMATVLPYLCMGIGQKYVSPTQAALIYLMEPVFAALIARFFIHETITPVQMLGAMVILSVQFFSILKNHLQRKKSIHL